LIKFSDVIIVITIKLNLGFNDVNADLWSLMMLY